MKVQKQDAKKEKGTENLYFQSGAYLEFFDVPTSSHSNYTVTQLKKKIKEKEKSN